VALVCLSLAAMAAPPRERSTHVRIPLWLDASPGRELSPKDFTATIDGASSRVLQVQCPDDDLVILLVLDLSSSDLTVADPLYVLPMATVAAMYFTFKKGGEAGYNPNMGPVMRRFMLYGLPGFTFIIAIGLPAATQVVFLTTSVWAYFQSSLLRSAAVRKFLGIQPLPPKTAPNAAPNTYKGTMTMYGAASQQSAPSSGALPRQNLSTWWAKRKEEVTSKISEKRKHANTVKFRQEAEAYEKKRAAELQAQANQSGKPRRK